MSSRALIVIVLVLLLSSFVDAQVVMAVQCGMSSYGNRVQSWVSPVTGVNYIADDPYVTNLASTTTRCYGAQHISFANGEDELYQCTRAGEYISWRFPSIANGNYRLFIILSEDKWTEFRNGNNGREYHLLIEGEFRDSLSPFGKLGVVQGAVQVEYCVTITDGDLEVEIDRRMFTTSQQAAIMCAMRLEVDNGTRGACPTPFTRYDDYWLPYRDIWTYSINCAGGAWRSPNGFMWQVDYGFYQPSGGTLVATGVPVPYDGMSSEDSAQLRNSDDIPVFQRRRVGDDTKYSLPLQPGNYMVVIWFLEWSDGAAIEWTYGGRKFDMFIEGVLVKTVDIFATCGAAYRACPMVFRNIAVSDGFLDVSFGTAVRRSATINGIQVKPEDGTPVPAYINYPGKFLADTGRDRPFNWPGVQGNVLYAINCGGGEYIAPDGLLFTVDWGYTGTSGTNTYGTSSREARFNTNYTQLYDTMRVSSAGVNYNIPVYDAGTYTVRMYFVEYEYNTGSRVITVNINGNQVDQFDILARGGGQYGAVEVDYEVTVGASQPIIIAISPVSGRPPLINGIEVRTGNLSTPRTIPVQPPLPPLPDWEQYPVPWDGSVPERGFVAPGPFPPYKSKVMPDGRELVFAINFAPASCDCGNTGPCGCGEYVSSDNITYVEPFPFFVPPYNDPICYGGVAGVHVPPGNNVPYRNDLPLGRCFASSFRAYFPDIPPGEYRLRTVHHEEKWATVLEFSASGTGGRGGYVDVNGLRIDTQDYLAKIGQKSVLYGFDHCITVDSRGHIAFESSAFPLQSSGPRIHAIELWKKDWSGECPFSIQDRIDLFADGGNCFAPVECIPCNGTADYGVLPCLRPWAPQGAIEYAINSGGAPYHSPVNNIDYSVDVHFGHGPWHRTGLAVGYDNNDGVVSGTDDDWLFTTRRSDSHGYWLPVSTSGRYLLVMGAMEWDRGYIGGRVWDLYVEDELIDSGIDVYHRCGAAYRACYLAYYVHVYDGMLNIYVKVVKSGAGVNNILLIRDDASPNSGLPAGIYLPPLNKPYNWQLQSGNVLVAINVGGGEVVDPNNGFVWFTDYYIAANDKSGTSTYGPELTGTTIAAQVFRSQRRSSTSISFDVILPANGMTVTLELFMSEYEYAQSGRTQSISVENGQVTDGPFDVFTCAGNSQGECKRTLSSITVADDVLSFSVERVSGRSAVLSAFRVIGISGVPANVSTPPPYVIPVVGRLSCPPGDLGCACFANLTCSVPYICSSYGGCQPVPPPQPTAPPQTSQPTAPPSTFAPAPTVPSTVAAGPPSTLSSSSGNSRNGSNKKATIIAVVVVIVVLAVVATAVMLFIFRERIFGGGDGTRRPTFHEEEMYAPKN